MRPDPFVAVDLWLLRYPTPRWRRFLSWLITPLVRREIRRWVENGEVG